MLEKLTSLAERWVESESAHERADLLVELREATEGRTEAEIIALLLEALHLEHTRADDQQAKAENWFRMYRGTKRGENFRDRREVVK